MATRECYIAMMEMEDQVQALNIEEHQTVTEPIEKLEEIPLDSSGPDRTTKIRTLANPHNPSRAHNLSQKQSRCICLES